MSDIKWSTPIPVNGRPEWLTDDIQHTTISGGCKWSAGYIPWSNNTITHVRVPADHPASLCQEWNDEHPDEPPFVPWCGGDAAPDDWDWGVQLFRDGSVEFVSLQYSGCWVHGRNTCHSDDAHDIVGYRRNSTNIAEPPTVVG